MCDLEAILLSEIVAVIFERIKITVVEGIGYHSSILGLLLWSAGKESSCKRIHLGSIPGLGRACGEGKGYPFQYSGLENSMDDTVHGIQRVRHN